MLYWNLLQCRIGGRVIEIFKLTPAENMTRMKVRIGDNWLKFEHKMKNKNKHQQKIIIWIFVSLLPIMLLITGSVFYSTVWSVGTNQAKKVHSLINFELLSIIISCSYFTSMSWTKPSIIAQNEWVFPFCKFA